jgi:hypothetical protein
MSESPTPSGGERAPPEGTHPAVHLRIDVDIDADAERPVDDDAELEEFEADIPIEAPIEDVIDQHIAVPFDDDVRSDAS